MSVFTPTIVIIAFNRPDSLQRLLSSVMSAVYPNEEVPLCICVDYQDSDANRKVRDLANSFEWPYGEKDVIIQSSNLGLKKHVLTCGDLTERFGSIIMLEDDLYVSPAYYNYATQALDFYEEDERIAGVSLYNHRINFSNQVPFHPIDDGTDVYFLQVASSWGQAWSHRQWKSFKKWMNDKPEVTLEMAIPSYVVNWPDKSWLKYFIAYLADVDKYFVYPRVSMTTNFGDTGENNAKSNFFFQVPLLLIHQNLSFSRFDTSIAKYDVYFDLQANIITKFNPRLSEYDFVNNLSGLKSLSSTTKKWVLVIGKCQNAEMSFALSMKPIEVNILFDILGDEISLVPTTTIKRNRSFKQRKKMFDYKYGLISPEKKIKNIFDVFRTKIGL